MRPPQLILPSLVALLVGGSHLAGQSLQTGALMGLVRDATGNPLAGAHVRAQSGQIARIAVTNERGEYRLSLLNPGPWSLTVSASGFQTSSAKATVSINERQTANFKLNPVQNVVVEVTSEVIGIDLSSVQTNTNISADKISKIPANLSSLNGLDAIMATVPGVQSSGDNRYYIAGGGHTQNLFTVDGNVTNVTGTNEAFYLVSIQPPREFMESVEVVTGGFGAEYNVMGGAINALTKSGSNAWAGEVFWYTDFPNAAAKGKWNPEIPDMTPPPPLAKYHRFGSSVSGPILKDKLFFFLGYQGYTEKQPAGSYTGDGGGTNWNGLVTDPTKVEGPNMATLKLNWFLNTDHQLVLSASHTSRTSKTNNSYPDFGTLNSGSDSKFSSQNVNLTWNWCISSELVLVSSVGKFRDPSSWTPRAAVPAGGAYSINDYRYFSEGPGRTAPDKPDMSEYLAFTTGAGRATNRSVNPNTQVRLDLTWSHRNHLVKAGYLQQDTEFESHSSRETIWNLFNRETFVSAIPGLAFDNQLERLAIDAYHQDLKGHLKSYYLKDVWEFLPGLRADLGFRYDPFTFVGGAYPYKGQQLGSFQNFGRQIQPRLGLTWDVNKDGKTKISAFWGRFMEILPLLSVSWASSTTSAFEYWLKEHYTYNADYVGGAFTLLTDPGTGQPYAPDLVRQNGTVGRPSARATDLRLSHKDMLQLGVEQMLPGGWFGSATWKFWEMRNVLASSYFTNSDGSLAFSDVTDKVLWNPGPGTVTFRDKENVLHTWNSPFPKPVDRFISLDLHASHHGENHSLSVDYTWVHHYGNYRGRVGNDMAYNAGNSSGGNEFSFYRAIASGNAESDPVHQVKISGYLVVPILGQKLNVGPLLTWQSGLGLSRTQPIAVLYPNYYDAYGNMQPANRRCDMGRTPSTFNVDLNLNMEVKVGRVTIDPTVSLSNLFNTRKATAFSTTYLEGAAPDFFVSPIYGKEIWWQEGRAFTAGVSVRF